MYSSVFETGQLKIAPCVSRGNRIRLHSNHPLEATRQRQSEQSNAAIKINRTFAMGISKGKVHQWAKQVLIYLKECIGIERVNFVAHL